MRLRACFDAQVTGVLFEDADVAGRRHERRKACSNRGGIELLVRQPVDLHTGEDAGDVRMRGGTEVEAARTDVERRIERLPKLVGAVKEGNVAFVLVIGFSNDARMS